MAETENDKSRPIGLLAGGGRLPFLVAEGVKRAGRQLAVVGFRGSVDPELKSMADRFSTASIARWSTIIRLLQRWGVRRSDGGARGQRQHVYPGQAAPVHPRSAHG